MTAETQWVRAASRGDAKAFQLLVERYQDYVFTIAMRILNDREEAEEVAQDVFVKVWRGLPTFEGRAAFSTWLYRIAWRAAIDRVRGRKKATTTLDDAGHPLQLPDEQADPQQRLAEGDLADHLKQAMSQLKPDDAALLTLYYFKELSVKEICEITGLTESNVKVKLFRARAALKERLQQTLQKEIDHLT